MNAPSRRSPTQWKLLGTLFGVLRPYRYLAAASAGLILISNALLLSFPYLAGKLLDVAKGIPSPYFSSLSSVLLFMGVIFAIQAIVSFARVYLVTCFAEKAIMKLRTRLFEKIIHLPVPFFDRYRIGDLMSRTSHDLSILQQTLQVTFVEGVRQTSMLFIGIGLIVFFTPRLSMVMIGLASVLALVSALLGPRIRQRTRQTHQQQAEAHTFLLDNFQIIHMIKAFVCEAFQVQRYAKAQKKVVAAARQAAQMKALFVSIMVAVLLGSIALTMGYGTYLVQRNVISTGELLSFLLYATFVGGSAAGLGDLYAQFQKALGAAERSFALLEEKEEITHPNSQSIAFENGNIEFEQLSFHYPHRPSVPVLKGLDLRLQQGVPTAILGKSGAGKSTLIALLLRFYTPQKGMIRVGGKAIQSFSLPSFRRAFALVPQACVLVSGSIEDNIRYGCPDATAADLDHAIQLSAADDFICHLPDGLQTRVGDRGVQLSGGQRQRIAIARAVIARPEILILDEASQGLDAKTEKQVLDSLFSYMENKTILFITHRPHLATYAHHVFHLAQGQAQEATALPRNT